MPPCPPTFLANSPTFLTILGVYFSSRALNSSSLTHPSWLLEILGVGYFKAVPLVPLTKCIREYGRGEVTSCCIMIVFPWVVRIVVVFMLPLKSLPTNSLYKSFFAASALARSPIWKSLEETETR